MRLFVSLEFSQDVKCKFLQLCQGSEFPFVKWDNFHLTLAFLGEIKGQNYHRIIEELEDIDFPELELRCTGIDLFKRGKEVTVFASIEPDEQLIQLQEEVKKKLKELDLSFEDRKFRPHVTLARLKHPEPEAIQRFLSLAFTPFSFKVQSFAVYSSLLKETGAEYKVEKSFPAY